MSEVTVPTATVVPAPSLPALQAEVEAARDDFTTALAALQSQVTPGALVDRAGRNVKGFYTEPSGGLNIKRVAITAGIVAGVIGLRLLTRRR